MKKIATITLFSASLAISLQAQSEPISEALEDLFSNSRTQELLSPQESSYLKIIPSTSEERSTIIYRCRHVEARSITDSIESATSPTGTVETADEQNIITVNDVNEKLDELKELILSIDSRGPQVLVEAQIIEVQMGDGMEWDAGLRIEGEDGSTGGFQLGGIKGFPVTNDSKSPFQSYPEDGGGWFDLIGTHNDLMTINARLRWLESHDKAEILSSPNLLVDLGTTATVSTGTDQPLLNVSTFANGVSQESVYYKRTGVNLRVTPLLINEDTVNLQIRPEVTSVVGQATLSARTEAPIISVRNIDTKLNVQDGGIVMMGGLYSFRDIEDEERVPVLSKIPVLGKLFTGTSTSQAQVQLVFLLKVTIVPDSVGSILTNIDSTQQEVKGVGEILKNSINPEQPGAGE